MTHVAGRLLLLLVLCLRPSGALAGTLPDDTVGVFLQFDNPFPGDALQQMEQEASAILKPAGYRFQWILPTSDTQPRVYTDLVVVRFQGTCDGLPVRAPDGEPHPLKAGEPLARTAISDGQVLPFSEVRCDEVNRFLSGATQGESPGSRSTLIGRALGRVVAHEMFHMFAASTQHGHRGVARSSHSSRELASATEFRFGPEEIRVLQGVRHHALQAAADVQTGSR